MHIKALRTPDDCFHNLPDYPFQPHYLDDLRGYEGLRVHYVDEGPHNADHTFLCLHGQPSWSYLYRKMIPVFAATGARVVAPDLLGFGKSDKPVEDELYTYDFHRNMLKALVEKLDLQNVTLVCQDWGGILGLTLPMDYPDRFKRIVAMNTTLPVGESPGQGFLDWKAYSASQPDMDVAKLMKRSSSVLSADEAAAYGAPYPDKDYKAGVRRFPELVMISPEMPGVETSRAAVRFLSRDWDGEAFLVAGAQDPVLGIPAMKQLQAIIRNASELFVVEEAGHFIQEWGDVVAAAALDYFGRD